MFDHSEFRNRTPKRTQKGYDSFLRKKFGVYRILQDFTVVLLVQDYRAFQENVPEVWILQ